MGRASVLTADERADIVLALLRREEPLSVFSRRAGAGAIRIVRWTEHPRRGTRTCAIVVADSAERGHSARPGEGGTG